MFFALEQIPYTDEASADVCSIWHLDVDILPEWILTSVHQVSVTRVNKDNMSTFLFSYLFIFFKAALTVIVGRGARN